MGVPTWEPESRRIWRSMVSVFRADREVVKACKEARRAHRMALANDLDMALQYGDARHAWELARLLANKTARSVRPIPPTRETASRDGCHMKKVFGADRTTNTGNIQDHDPPYQCGSLAEIAATIPPLQKRARRLARYRAVPSWATRDSCDVLGCATLRCLHVWLGVGKMIFGGWLELIEDPYRHWQVGFVRNRGVTDCLAIRWAIWERAAKQGGA